MQFIVTGYDGKDPGAYDRRMAAREAHLACARQMYLDKKFLCASALLDEQERMIGSVIIVEFESEQALREEWLAKEPYVLGKVWAEIKIEPCKVASFCR